MAFGHIRYEVHTPIASVILNRPKQRNAQSRQLLEEMDQAFTLATEDDNVKVIVVYGEGDHFSAGHDLGSNDERADQERRPYPEGVRGRFIRSKNLYVDYSLRWRDIPKPTIAAVQGYCIFGGWIVASSMDMIFAASDAMFLGTNFQYFSVPWDLHPRKAKELLFESRFIDAREAERLELVNRVYSPSDLLRETMVYAGRIAENDSFQLRMIKTAINQQQDVQGYKAHIDSAHAYHLLSAMGESDPGFELHRPEGKRRPMVEKALQNYRRFHGNDLNDAAGDDEGNSA
ncbi:MAG: enoyl-CoA hydratase [Gammaproteobacteria bacterium]|uniref:Enoyl-CoA hydratase n=1 Tax=OM182 bacterium MED-G24 TaxID=1986255 RepID=A0A2A5WIB3_9GAMM|nr:enoyl-CoA hydratase [Gammaproteobacteria bacterium]PDH36171.1 MAG: enoyl-CoA hydratase [OM182 bacterium MED-G24]RPG24132.1 MAG: enoyl-CoA hydratase [Gammaproteobacteria bacterium TMED50]|tara:strand:+ start:49 stop:912 length:864 start_codon:yes stop_codon:yes gene_type:complete